MSQDIDPKTLKPYVPGRFVGLLPPEAYVPTADGRSIPVGTLATYSARADAALNGVPALKVGTHGDMLTIDAARALTNACHGPAKASGWWTDLKTGEALTIDTPRFVVEKLCLVHSEISEAMEGHRRGLMDDKLPHRTMLEVELADAAIRIFDMAGGFGLDVAGAIAEKLLYNRTRADHQLSNRHAVGGKAF